MSKPRDRPRGGGIALAGTALPPPFEVSLDAHAGESADLPARLAAVYGGPLALPRRRLCANFVTSLDGVTALDSTSRASGSDISLKDAGDHLVMGLLRAWADAVLVGAGTLRLHRSGTWLPGSPLPGIAGDLDELRRGLGRAPEPRLAVVTASGNIDPAHPGLQRDTLVITAEGGAAALRRRLPSSCTVVGLTSLDGGSIARALGEAGLAAVLCEGGPHLLGTLVDAGAVDELFLTLSPVIAGREEGDHRLGLVHGTHLLPERSSPARLVSLRRGGDHLFLRYRLTADDDPTPGDDHG